MTKNPKTVGELLDALPTPRTYSPYSKWCFYRPHNRLRFMNEVTNPITGEVTYPPSRTKQEFKDQCDINNIIKAYKITGQVTHINAKAALGAYMDLPDETDFQTSLNTIREAEEAFASLPAKVRDRFKNDPSSFLSFLNDPKNRDEAIQLGLVTPPPVAAPPPAPVSPEEPSKP